MKFFINRKLRRNPWGGGIQFATGFVDYIESLGYQVTNQYDNDIDVILMMDPRDDDGFGDINQLLRYKKFLDSKGKKVKVVHRINDSDIARGTNFLVDLNIKANKAIADKTIFISSWIRDHYIEKGFNRENTIIHNGCNHEWFYPQSKKDVSFPIKVVTHHWSDNFNKGFDTYIELDKRLNDRIDIQFTYVGRYYKGYSPINTKLVDPLYGEALGNELRKHDIYLTAARYEACGMHHIEASSCGLPVIYHKDGGGINEICKNHGIQISKSEDVCDAILEAFSKKDDLVSKINYDSLNSISVNKAYVDYMLK
jgi:hypothetical protein